MEMSIVKGLVEVNNAVIIHHNDMDGRSGAALCMLAIDTFLDINSDNVELYECDYNHKYDYVDMVKDNETVLIIVDYSIPPEDLIKIKKNKMEDKNHIIFLDHHESAYKIYKDVDINYFGKVEFVSDKMEAKSGVELAYDFFYGNKPINNIEKRVVNIVGDFDTWRHAEMGKKGKDSLHFKYAMEYASVSDFHSILQKNRDFNLQHYFNIGKSIEKHINEKNTEKIERFAFETKIKGFEQYSVLAVNTSEKSSLTFGDRFDDYDICIAFIFDGEKFTYGIYSKDINVSEIAMSFGGGGHPGASGFTTKELVI